MNGVQSGKTRQSKRPKELAPLRHFDYGLVKSPFEGLLFNTDRDLERLVNQAVNVGDVEADRKYSLFHVFMRFARNSYESVLYLAGDVPPDPRRKPTYALVVPAINRQLLDLLFSLVYMLDDLPARSLIYQRAAYREGREEIHQFRSTFGNDSEWQAFFRGTKAGLESMVARFSITPEEVQNPKLIPYWKHPFDLSEEATPSREYLRYLNKWLYSDTSAQAHLSFAGLLRMSPFLLADLADADAKKPTEERTMKQFHFIHISRTAITTLAILSEINRHCNLGNDAATDFLWTMFSEHVAEGKEMWTRRYRPATTQGAR